MYLIYESYTDECRNLKDLLVNTKIVGLFKDKEQALECYDAYLESTITQSDGEYDWFMQEFDTSLLENKNIIKAYRVYNEDIETYSDYYMVILEEVIIWKQKVITQENAPFVGKTI